MASLSETALQLPGGCFCGAIKYNISVPALANRPRIPGPKDPHPLGPQSEATTKVPILLLDHCDTCRGISGSIIECWFVAPMSWTTFTLEPLTSSASEHLSPATSDLVKGDKAILEGSHLRSFKSSEDVWRTFCGKCGTHLTYWYGSADNVVPKSWGPYFNIAVGSIGKEGLALLAPSREANVEDAVGWVRSMITGGANAE